MPKRLTQFSRNLRHLRSVGRHSLRSSSLQPKLPVEGSARGLFASALSALGGSLVERRMLSPHTVHDGSPIDRFPWHRQREEQRELNLRLTTSRGPAGKQGPQSDELSRGTRQLPSGVLPAPGRRESVLRSEPSTKAPHCLSHSSGSATLPPYVSPLPCSLTLHPG